MKALNELLTENELYVYLHFKEMTHKEMAEVLGVTTSRIAQYRNTARKKIREAKRLDINNIWNNEEVTVSLERREIYLIQHALRRYSLFLEPTLGEYRRNEIDPEQEMMAKLNEKLHTAIKFEEHPSRIDFDAYWNQDADI